MVRQGARLPKYVHHRYGVHCSALFFFFFVFCSSSSARQAQQFQSQRCHDLVSGGKGLQRHGAVKLDHGIDTTQIRLTDWMVDDGNLEIKRCISEARQRGMAHRDGGSGYGGVKARGAGRSPTGSGCFGSAALLLYAAWRKKRKSDQPDSCTSLTLPGLPRRYVPRYVGASQQARQPRYRGVACAGICCVGRSEQAHRKLRC